MADGDEEAVGQSEEMLGTWHVATATDCRNGDGKYCGRNGVKGAADALYECRGGQYRRIQTCSSSGQVCKHMPDGYDDRCGAASNDADEAKGEMGLGGYAGSCAGRGLGAKYCGQHLIGFGTPNALYECRSDGNGYLVSVCNAGCQPVDGPSDDYCKSGGGASSFPRMTAARVQATDNVNLRTGPGVGYDVVTVVPQGAVMNLGDVGNGLVTTNGYWPVYYGNMHGWASRTYLALQQ